MYVSARLHTCIAYICAGQSRRCACKFFLSQFSVTTLMQVFRSRRARTMVNQTLAPSFCSRKPQLKDDDGDCMRTRARVSILTYVHPSLQASRPKAVMPPFTFRWSARLAHGPTGTSEG